MGHSSKTQSGIMRNTSLLPRILWRVVAPGATIFIAWMALCYHFETSHPILFHYIPGTERDSLTPLLLDNRTSTIFMVGDEVAINLGSVFEHISIVRYIIEVNESVDNGYYLTKGIGSVDDRHFLYHHVYQGKEWLERHEIVGKLHGGISFLRFFN